MVQMTDDVIGSVCTRIFYVSNALSYYIYEVGHWIIVFMGDYWHFIYNGVSKAFTSLRVITQCHNRHK